MRLLCTSNNAASGQGVATKTLEQYERLLDEHLGLWASQKTAEQVRLWAARLAEAQQRHDDAIEHYQAIGPNSPHSPERFSRLVSLYRRILDQRNQPVRLKNAREWFQQQASRVTDAAQVILVLGETARLHLFYEPYDYPLAQRRIERALELAGDGQAVASLRGLLVVALAGQRKVPLAEAELLQVTSPNPNWLVDVLRGLMPVLDSRPDDASLRRLLRDACQRIGPQPTLPRADELIWRQALAEVEPTRVGLDRYARLAAANPDHQRIQLRLAQLLTNSNSRENLTRALEQWRRVVKMSPVRSRVWFWGKLGIASVHHRLGNLTKAREMLQLTQGLYPDLGGPEIKRDYLRLLSEVEKE